MSSRQRFSLLSALLALFSCQGPPPRTVVPEPSLEDRAAAAGWHDGRPWMDQHLDGVKIASQGNCDLLLVGDSITQSWGGPGRRVGAPAADVFRHWFGQIRVGNLGISGDRTQHLLWRIENGTLDGANPDVITILIGTNNIHHDPPADIARGIEAVVMATRKKVPDALILLHPILARGKNADDEGRQDVLLVNDQLDHLANIEGVEIIDLDAAFLHSDGTIREELYSPDALHLSAAGYEAWARTLAQRLRAAGLAMPADR
ncbi:MAG: GDSL-type esterase/lipase family protein [Planctomycetota bacterium]|nr:GDSL-type esterase/lipase family protein [Planctomycetota bacterium]